LFGYKGKVLIEALLGTGPLLAIFWLTWLCMIVVGEVCDTWLVIICDSLGGGVACSGVTHYVEINVVW
jgi:hypothetical protein